MVIAAAFTGFAVIIASWMIRLTELHKVYRTAIIGSLVFLFAETLLFASYIAREQRTVDRMEAYGRVGRYIDANSRKNEAIGYLMSSSSYCFYGRKLDRRLVWVPSKSSDPREWAMSLREQGIRLVAVGPVAGEWRSGRELSWLDEEHGPFVRVFEKDPSTGSIVYKLVDKKSDLRP